jgi:hypothetical protein
MNSVVIKMWSLSAPSGRVAAILSYKASGLRLPIPGQSMMALAHSTGVLPNASRSLALRIPYASAAGGSQARSMIWSIVSPFMEELTWDDLVNLPVMFLMWNSASAATHQYSTRPVLNLGSFSDTALTMLTFGTAWLVRWVLTAPAMSIAVAPSMAAAVAAAWAIVCAIV